MIRQNHVEKGLILMVIVLLIGVGCTPCIKAYINDTFSGDNGKYSKKILTEYAYRFETRASQQCCYLTEDGKLHTMELPRKEVFFESFQEELGDKSELGVLVDGGNHPPIYIEGNDDFTPDNGVTGSSGTEDDPYIIENWVILGSVLLSDGMFINNTDVYFIIRNCTVKNFYGEYCSGIIFNNVENGRIEETDTSYNYNGIEIRYSNYITIVNCTCYNNHGWYAQGIYCYRSLYITIAGCKCYNNHGTAALGIRFGETSYSVIENTDVYDNDYVGLYFISHHKKNPDRCIHNTITDCKIYDNSCGGIFVSGQSKYTKPTYNQILRCEIYNNGLPPPGVDNGLPGLTFWDQYNSVVEDCSIHNNGGGIEFEDCSNNLINNCSVFNHTVESSILATGIFVAGCFVTLDITRNNIIINCDIYNNEMGIWLLETLNTKVQKNNIVNNSYFGLCSEKIPLGINTGYINYNNIYGNGFAGDEEWRHGLYAEYSFFDARNNWWGNKDGPSDRGSGHGDRINWWRSIILYKPWAKEPIPDAGVK